MSKLENGANAQGIENEGMNVNNTAAPMSAIERLKAAAAAKYNTAPSVTTETTVEQRIKDITRKVVANITLTAALQILASVTLAENVDVEKTAQKLVLNAKKDLTTLSKTLQEGAAAGMDVDVEGLNNFSMANTKIELVTYELPPLFKGAVMAIDFANISDDARQKLQLIGVTADEPFAILTALSFDKSANSVFAKVGGFDLTKGTVRLSLKFVALVADVNEPQTVEAYDAKVVELTALIQDAKLKISAKSFDYVADKLLTPQIAQKFAVLLPEGYTPEQLNSLISSLSTILRSIPQD